MRLPVVLATLVVAVSACGEAPSAPATLRSSTAAVSEIVPSATNSFQLCKSGSAATFTYSVAGRPSVEVSLEDGECRYLHTWDGAPGEFQTVTVTELATYGTVLDSIVKDSITDYVPNRRPTLIGVATVTGVVYHSKGVIAHYYNSPLPPVETQGCTPGYWKQRQHFDSWVGYVPSQQFSSIFADAFPGQTLLQVLSAGGGGKTALGRHTVAALLNASAAVSGLTTAQVVAAFNAAIDSGDFETQKNVFEGLNELGCPLN